MPVGKPDDGFNPNALSSNQTDVGAGVDRLLMGGGSVFRAGRVIWATGFENGQPTDFQLTGSAGSTQRIVVGAFGASAWQGNNCLLLITPQTLNAFSKMNKPYPATLSPGKWGIEAMVSFEGANNNFDINFSKGAPAGGTVLSGTIRFAFGTSPSVFVQMRSAAGPYVTFVDATSFLAVGYGGLYYNVKWVPDWGNKNYGAFYLNNTRYDLSAFPLPTSGSGGDESSFFNFTLTTLTTSIINETLIDNVILTADEP